MAGILEAKEDAREILSTSRIDDTKRFKRLLAFLKYHSRRDGEAAKLYEKLRLLLDNSGSKKEHLTASDYEGPPVQEAIEWAKNHPTKLLPGIDEKVAIRLAQIVSDGIKNKRGIAGISRDIRKELPDINKDTADTIALTETSNALGQSFLERGRAMNIEAKQWYAGDNACGDCVANAAVGVIPFEQPFPSGHMSYPAHPGCRCAVAPARFGRVE